MPKTPPPIDPLRRLRGQRDYYRRAISYDAEKVRTLSRELAAALIEQFICDQLAESELPLTAGQVERLTALLQGGPADV